MHINNRDAPHTHRELETNLLISQAVGGESLPDQTYPKDDHPQNKSRYS